MVIKEINGYRIAMPESGKIFGLESLKELKEFSINNSNTCDGFYAESESGQVYDYINGIPQIVGRRESISYVLNDETQATNICQAEEIPSNYIQSLSDQPIAQAEDETNPQELYAENQVLIEQDKSNKATIAILQEKLKNIHSVLQALCIQIEV